MLKLLLKVRFASMFSRSSRTNKKGGSNTGRNILFLFLMIYAFSYFFVVLYNVYNMMLPQLAAEDLAWFVFALSGVLAIALSLLTDVQTARSQIYEARDNDLLMSMPFKPSAILLSRLLAVYLFSLVYSLMVFLPAVAVSVRYGIMNVPQVLCALFALLVSECIPIAVACLLARLFTWLRSRFPGFRIVSVIFSTLLLLAYMYAVFNFSNLMPGLQENAVRYANAFRHSMYPFYIYGRACMGDPVSLLILIVFTAALCLPVLLYLSRTLLSSVSASGHTRTVRGRLRSYRPHTVMGALVRREILHFTGSTTYMFNAGFGLVIELIFSIFYLIRGDAFAGNIIVSILGEPYQQVLPTAILCVLQSMILISACSVSLERNQIWIIQSVPVSAKHALWAKAFAHVAVCLPVSILSSLLCIIGCRAWNIYGLFMLLLPLLMCLLCALVGVRANMMFPRLDYLDDTAAVKRSPGVLITMLLVWTIAAIGIVPLFLPFYPPYAGLVICMFVLIVACLLVVPYLNGRGARHFAHLS